MPPVLAIGAVAALGYAVFKFAQKIDADNKQELAFRAANGWSFTEVAGDLTARFSDGGDGGFTYDTVNGVKTLAEGTYKVSRTYTTSPGPVISLLAPGTKVVREASTTYSIEPLLRRADANRDGIATKLEIEQALRAYDADGNGRLSEAERARAKAELSAVAVAQSDRAVGIVQPPPKPVPPPKRA